MEVDLLAKNKSDNTSLPSKVNNQDSELEVNNQDSEVKKDSSKTMFSRLKNYFSSNKSSIIKVISSLVVIILTVLLLTLLTFSLFIILAQRVDKIDIITAPVKLQPTSISIISDMSIVSSRGLINKSEFQSEYSPSLDIYSKKKKDL
jgi:hypothetical protein